MTKLIKKQIQSRQIHLTAHNNSLVKETPRLTLRTLSNLLTLIRILLIPGIIGLLFLPDFPWHLLAAIFFGIAALTDYLDGYLARKHKNETLFGSLMDPLADKFLIISSLIMLLKLDRIHPVLVILLICRDIGITGLRAIASSQGWFIPTSSLAKWKTATQMIAIPLLMLQSMLDPFGLGSLGSILIYLSLIISLWSAKNYSVHFLKQCQ